jgi:hypothetical protein
LPALPANAQVVVVVGVVAVVSQVASSVHVAVVVIVYAVTSGVVRPVAVVRWVVVRIVSSMFCSVGVSVVRHVCIFCTKPSTSGVVVVVVDVVRGVASVIGQAPSLDFPPGAS